jgi:hypothetical protein
MELSMIIETKNLQNESCVKRCAEATHERKILNDEPCAMNLTNSFKTFSNEIKDVYQTKLKTDSQNGFISSRCIFFV